MLIHRLFTHRKQAGLPPGTVHKPLPDMTVQEMHTLTLYNKDMLMTQKLQSPMDGFANYSEESVNWYHNEGTQNQEYLQFFAEKFNIHSLVMEDVSSPGQRPKLEDYEEISYIHVKFLSFDTESLEINIKPVNLIFGDHFLLSFQATNEPIFNAIFPRLENQRSRLRKYGTDYLCYVLIDIIVDNYFGVLEHIGDQIEQLEADILEDGNEEFLNTIHKIRRELLVMRKIIPPTMAVCHELPNNSSPVVDEAIHPFLRDLEDHLSRITDTIDLYHSMLANLMDLHYNAVNQRTNEIMRMLTVIASIFIPLTFIAGVYGMNFEHMPELQWPYSYPILIGFMVIVTMVMIYYFRRRDWI